MQKNMLYSCFSEPVGYGHGELKLNLPRSFGDFDTDGAYDIAYSREGMVIGILRLSFDMCRKEGVLDNMSPTVFAEFYNLYKIQRRQSGVYKH